MRECAESQCSLLIEVYGGVRWEPVRSVDWSMWLWGNVVRACAICVLTAAADIGRAGEAGEEEGTEPSGRQTFQGERPAPQRHAYPGNPSLY